ncbi:MAG TPA: solute carrier 26 family protein [Anaerolineae bacterium]|nr:solute carrier 26 family protein [Anaerolineae bacterium]
MRFFPIIGFLRTYKREYLSGDLIAGLIVAIMLIPQGMAYALLAGLPPQQGLYASILPVLIYGIFGTSRYLAVGPVAIVSLLTAASIGALAEGGSAEYATLAITLAFLVAIIQFGMGLFRAGFLVNFLSHPVLSGFSSAAAIVIGFSQVKSLLGIKIPRSEHFYEQVVDVFKHLPETNLTTLAIGIAGILVLFYFKKYLGQQLQNRGISEHIAVPITKTAPLLIVVVSAIIVAAFGLHDTANVSIVGDVPAGLPPLSMPSFDMGKWATLLTTALAISFVGYMESISVAKSLASKGREKVDANQELIALGLANFGSTLTGGYPVTGGFSRSLVNYAAGARTTLASIITAILIGLSVVFLTPLFYFIPKTTLAAIIIVAVTGLFDLKTLLKVWPFNKRDAAALIVTFVAVLALGVENGVVIGAVTSLLMFIARTSDPHVAEIGRLPNSPFYRNTKRHETQTWPDVAMLRIDASLYFANTNQLEDAVAEMLINKPKLKHLILVGTAINDVDYTAAEALEEIWRRLRDLGIQLHLAGFKGPVLDRLRCGDLIDHLGQENVHRSTHDAIVKLGLA